MYHNHRHSTVNYPYDPASHTYASPGGMSYPAIPGRLPHHYRSSPIPPPVNPHHLSPFAQDFTPTSTASIRAPDPRTQLGVGFHHGSPSLSYLPVRPSPRAQSHNPSPSHSPVPRLERSWTLGAPPHVDPLSAPPHLDIPLTSSPLGHRPELGLEFNRSFQDGPAAIDLHIARVTSASHQGRFANNERGEAGAKQTKKGGPPKAILGGPGGKTYEQMQGSKSASPSPAKAIHAESDETREAAATVVPAEPRAELAEAEGRLAEDTLLTTSPSPMKGNRVKKDKKENDSSVSSSSSVPALSTEIKDHLPQVSTTKDAPPTELEEWPAWEPQKTSKLPPTGYDLNSTDLPSFDEWGKDKANAVTPSISKESGNQSLLGGSMNNMEETPGSWGDDRTRATASSMPAADVLAAGWGSTVSDAVQDDQLIGASTAAHDCTAVDPAWGEPDAVPSGVSLGELGDTSRRFGQNTRTGGRTDIKLSTKTWEKATRKAQSRQDGNHPALMAAEDDDGWGPLAVDPPHKKASKMTARLKLESGSSQSPDKSQSQPSADPWPVHPVRQKSTYHGQEASQHDAQSIEADPITYGGKLESITAWTNKVHGAAPAEEGSWKVPEAKAADFKAWLSKVSVGTSATTIDNPPKTSEGEIPRSRSAHVTGGAEEPATLISDTRGEEAALADGQMEATAPLPGAKTREGPTRRLVPLTGNSFLKRTLGDLIQDGSRRKPRVISDANIDVNNEAGTTSDRPMLGRQQSLIAQLESTERIPHGQAMSTTPKRLSPLDSPQDNSDDDATMRGKDPFGSSPRSTITPARSKRVRSALQDSFDMTSDMKQADHMDQRGSDQEDIAENDDGLPPTPPLQMPRSASRAHSMRTASISTTESNQPQPTPVRIQLRPTVPAFVPAGRTLSTAAIRDSAPRQKSAARDTLRPWAPVFAPASNGKRVVSAPMAENPSPPSHSDPSRRASLGDEQDGALKRIKLRPTASDFVPLRSPEKPRRRPDGSNVADNGQRLVPDTFAFAPRLEGLRPNAAAFVPGAFVSTVTAPTPPVSALPLSSVPHSFPVPYTGLQQPDCDVFQPVFRSGASPRLVQPASASSQETSDIGVTRAHLLDRDRPTRRPENSHHSIDPPRLGSPRMSRDDVTILKSMPLSASPVKESSLPLTSPPGIHGLGLGTPVAARKDRIISMMTDPEESIVTADGSPLRPDNNPGGSMLSPSPNVASPLMNEPEPPEEDPAITDPAVVQQKFRDWQFPLEAEGPPDRRPSIERRHTMPVEAMGRLEAPAPAYGPGIASTLAERVGDLRTYLGGRRESADADSIIDGGVSTQTSVEFPLRPEKKELVVVNNTPARASSPSLSPLTKIREPAGQDASAELLRKVERVISDAMESNGVKEMLRGLGERVELYFERLESQRNAASRQTDTATPEPSLQDLMATLQSMSATLTGLSSHTGEKFDQDSALAQARTYEMVQTILALQQDIRSQLVEQVKSAEDEITLSTLDAVSSTLDQLVLRVDAAEDSRERVSGLMQRIDHGRTELAVLESENGHLRWRLQEKEALAQRTGEAEAKLAQVSQSVWQNERLVDELRVAKMAAEAERDALARAVGDRDEEVREMGIVITNLQQECALNKKKAFEAEARAQEMADGKEQATVAVQQELLKRIALIDDGVRASQNAAVRQHEDLLERNKKLEAQVDSLKDKLEATFSQASKATSERDTARMETDHVRSSLEAQLRREKDAQSQFEARISELERQLGQARLERENAMMMANERTVHARHQEVQIQALSQERVYWRQFALESDRRKYKAFMASKPFQYSPPEAELKTPGLEQQADDQMTPTKKKYPANGTVLVHEEKSEFALGLRA